MPDRQFDSVIRFSADASQLFASIQQINAQIQNIGKTGGGAGGADPLNLGKLGNVEEPIRRVGQATTTTAGHFERLTRNVVESMLVWQGVNIAINAVGDTMSRIGAETTRLDDAAARLSVTLGTSKDSAMAFAQAYSMMGVAYGLRPEEALPQAQYAARVARTPQRQEEMFNVSAQLGRVTGEDPKKLIDDLNVAYKQTGISITQLGDMAVKAWQNSGTSASEYLNILREVGPLAKSSGIDIDRMAGIAAAAADRMGGSMSDAANTLTRLIKATQEPNQMQFDVLTKYGIRPGGDVQEMLDQISKANMSAVDLAALGGRPGMPAVANDIRTMVAVFKEYNGELQKGAGLTEAYTKSTDSMDMAVKQLGAGWDVFLGSLSKVSGAIGVIKELASVFTDAAKSIQYLQGVGLPGWMQQFLGGVTGQGNVFSNPSMNVPYTGGMYQPGMQGQNVVMPATATAIGGPQPGVMGLWNQPITGMGKVAAGLETGAYELPTSATDISKYTQSQIDRALAIVPQMMESTLQTYRVFLESLGLPPEKINELIKAREDSINSYMSMFQTGQTYTMMGGAQAYFLKPALGLTEQRDTRADRQKDLEERIKELKESMEDLNDTQKKAVQLQGMWNIPAGARILAPIAGGAMRGEEGGGEGGAGDARRARIQREIEKLEAELAKVKAEGAGGGGMLPRPPERERIEPLLSEQEIDRKMAAMMSREDRQAAQSARAATDTAVQNSMAMLGSKFPTAQFAEIGAGTGAGIGASGTIGETIKSSLITGLAQIRSDVSVDVKPLPVYLTTILKLDSAIIAQEVQKAMVLSTVDQARATGFYAGPR